MQKGKRVDEIATYAVHRAGMKRIRQRQHAYEAAFAFENCCDGVHCIDLEPYDYRWYRVGGLAYAIRREAAAG